MRKNIRLIIVFCSFLASLPIYGCSQKIISFPDFAKEPERIYEEEDKYSEGSLWPGETSSNMLFVDSKARNIGDIVTVLISENSSATKKATTDTSRDSSAELATAGLFGLPSHFGLTNLFGLGKSFNPNLNSSNKNKFKGAGTTTREDKFTATLAAIIIETLPNGNFKIKGKRKVSLNKENQILTLDGIIRPEDISFNNTIDSKLIANAKISYSGSGVLSEKQRVGWGIRVLDWVWPF